MTTQNTGKQNTGQQNADHKLIVQRALAQLVGTGDVDALGKVLSDDFVHHRPDATSRTKAEWLAAVRASPLGDMRVDVLHLLADGDHVVMHSRRHHPGTGAEITGVDIWRFDDGLIAEAWGDPRTGGLGGGASGVVGASAHRPGKPRAHRLAGLRNARSADGRAPPPVERPPVG
ncbi:hypothetical protein SMD44_07880 [Streptomyces alboflavus]|uniref:SnoaL-like domain-containing protein n=1 Tax=Streptomyces alboflavus TaxID=67267 RepID=A0A1Z1WPN9_9ACTN|nr:nuclear transport factor 2 family protein [Streptomyces alboflavus]ARX88393.1 hypothetical protein SMD44_07880 [Streptomyces alboflavus]